jgi:hypothetical protein
VSLFLVSCCGNQLFGIATLIPSLDSPVLKDAQPPVNAEDYYCHRYQDHGDDQIGLRIIIRQTTDFEAD